MKPIPSHVTFLTLRRCTSCPPRRTKGATSQPPNDRPPWHASGLYITSLRKTRERRVTSDSCFSGIQIDQSRKGFASWLYLGCSFSESHRLTTVYVRQISRSTLLSSRVCVHKIRFRFYTAEAKHIAYLERRLQTYIRWKKDERNEAGIMRCEYLICSSAAC